MLLYKRYTNVRIQNNNLWDNNEVKEDIANVIESVNSSAEVMRTNLVIFENVHLYI
jgi:hypothetical protein